MSMSEVVQHECPKCHEKTDFTIWRSINTMLDPELKQKIKDGSLFQFACPHCGEKTNVLYPFLYHQMEDRIMIQLAGDRNEVEEFKDFLSQKPDFEMLDWKQNGYVVRIVTTLPDLLEKIAIFDAKLDDRIIEISKLIIRAKRGAGVPKIAKALFFDDPENGHIIILYNEAEKAFGNARLTDDLYKNLCESFMEKLPDFGTGVLEVDAGWALEFLKGLPKTN